MKLIYIDESGDTDPLTQRGSRYLVLTACIVDERDRCQIEKDLRKIKTEYYADPDIEFKSNFIRYANPDLPRYNSPLKLHIRERYNDLENELTNFLASAPVELVSVVIDKQQFWLEFPSASPYEVAYALLLQNLNILLAEKKLLGLVIIDPREGRVEKRFIGDDLELIHHSLRFNAGKPMLNTDRIVERLLYSDSKNTIGIQLADLYCYPLFHIFEYDKEPGDYWRYVKVTYPKMHKRAGKILGNGLYLFPKITKNGLDIRPALDGREIPRDHQNNTIKR